MAEQLSVMRALALLPLVALVSCASTVQSDSADRAKLDTELAARTAGKPQTCIRLDEAVGTQAYRDVLVYRPGRRVTYVNAAPGCTGNDTDPIFVNEVHGSQLCRGDVIRTVSRTGGFQTGFCILGDFTPYRAAPR
ncbi:hypothetical protein [Sphingomonas sp. SUN039]|uniref:hypothetical protein n=1 Tax=Sphingomonas sp. SUN039 TaxID=2937787 RepID=UPI0021640D45|nr:hypothetical protein [Sphingomonas sp. SUN039]UVO54961.1 hypothetical protein M0209_12800 [Sphingomonas sp. SUN039]